MRWIIISISASTLENMILNQVKMKKTEMNTPQIDSDGVSIMIRIGFSLNRDLPVRLLGRMVFLNLRQQ
jgi:hypothetical protein